MPKRKPLRISHPGGIRCQSVRDSARHRPRQLRRRCTNVVGVETPVEIRQLARPELTPPSSTSIAPSTSTSSTCSEEPTLSSGTGTGARLAWDPDGSGEHSVEAQRHALRALCRRGRDGARRPSRTDGWLGSERSCRTSEVRSRSSPSSTSARRSTRHGYRQPSLRRPRADCPPGWRLREWRLPRRRPRTRCASTRGEATS